MSLDKQKFHREFIGINESKIVEYKAAMIKFMGIIEANTSKLKYLDYKLIPTPYSRIDYTPSLDLQPLIAGIISHLEYKKVHGPIY